MRKIPLLVHLVFHPESGESRQLARHIHQQLNDDVVVPGLRVPTVFCPYPQTKTPPSTLRLDLAEHSFVVVLADDRMSIDDDWCSFAANVWVSCQDSPHRFVPFQLSKNAYPLDKRLKGVSFARAYLQPDSNKRTAFTVRRVVTELCRYLLNREIKDDKSTVPIKLFLSHTKADFDTEPKVTQQLIEYLKADQPVEAWVDSGVIYTGSEFANEIERGVERTSLLVILTDNYATREWCREEVLLAKEHQRPIAVVDALTQYEVRSFPYLGNVPRIRWEGNPQSGVDLLLKETLRYLHTTLVLERAKLKDDVVFIRPPELATLVGLPPDTHVLYPDPPIGIGEARRLAKTKVDFATPLQRLALNQPLHGKKIALSMSESTDIWHFGMDALHLEISMLEMSRYLLIQGATLAYGGHLGTESYTRKLIELVRTHNAREGVEPFERIVNYRGWPFPRLNVEQKAEIKQESLTEELQRPGDINEELHPDFVQNPNFFPGDKSVLHRFAWARGMTDMRTYQANQSQSGVMARIVMGGVYGPTLKVTENGMRKEQWYAGRIPGVLEEVFLSAQMGQPIFLIGAFGGAAKLIIDILQGENRKEATWAYQKNAPFAPELRALYDQRGLDWKDYDEIIAYLRKKGIAGINPLLTEEAHTELFQSVDPWRMVEIVMQGLKSL